MEFFKHLRKILQVVRVAEPGTDAGNWPVQKISYAGKVSEVATLFPYGYHANMTAAALGLLLNANGVRFVVAGVPLGRPKMAAGENCVYHPPSGSIIHFRASGDIEIRTEKNVIVTAAESVTVDSPTVNFTGDVNIAGGLNVGGDADISGATNANGGLASTGVHTNNGVNVGSTHYHVGSPPTAVPVP